MNISQKKLIRNYVQVSSAHRVKPTVQPSCHWPSINDVKKSVGV